MSYLYNQRNRMLAGGSTVRDNQISIAKKMIIQSFMDNPSYYQVTINNSPTPSDVWVVDDAELIERKQIQTKPDADVLNVGDLIYWDNINWLTLNVDTMGGIYYRGVMEKCNSILSLQSPPTKVDTGQVDGMGRPIYQETSGITNNYPCIVKTRFRLSTPNDQVIDLPEGRLQISFQYNATDPMITENTEFIMYGRRFKVSYLDFSLVINNKGVITITADRLQEG